MSGLGNYVDHSFGHHILRARSLVRTACGSGRLLRSGKTKKQEETAQTQSEGSSWSF
jgi:hypothetical protein